jgi:pimeloyl-ACP methyl ester carboxylesterase
MIREVAMRVSRWLVGLSLICTAPAQAQTPAPTALIDNGEYAFVPDQRYIWHGPEAARGVIVWGHGLDIQRKDLRGQKPPEFLRPLNEAGYDVVRYDRDPFADSNSHLDYVVTFLHDGLVELRKRGWKHIVAAGQSRGGINALSLLKTPGVADVIVTTSAAMAGTDPGEVASRGEANLYVLLHNTPPQATRVMYVQFLNDPFAGDADKRARRVREMVGPNVSALALIDRPDGFTGHSAGASTAFAEKFSACIKSFVMDAVPPKAC